MPIVIIGVVSNSGAIISQATYVSGEDGPQVKNQLEDTGTPPTITDRLSNFAFEKECMNRY